MSKPQQSLHENCFIKGHIRYQCHELLKSRIGWEVTVPGLSSRYHLTFKGGALPNKERVPQN